MYNVYKLTLPIIFAVLSFSIFHGGITAASSLSHTENSSSTQNSISCKPVCHSSPAANRSKLIHIKKDEREPIPPDERLVTSFSATTLKSLLTDREIWKLASWIPPDQLLISSAYSTSL